ncbi:MAG: GPR1/FUN34/YaaH family transporter [Clostridiales bacterium]|nr:GPR1/FUN34/YaaH family transporter [Clostridiales bacterium]
MEKSQEIKVQTKEWSNPTPAGLVALAVACFCFFGMLNGFVDKSALPLIGCWLIGGFVVQLVVGLLDLKSGNGVGGNTFLFFSAFFMLVGGIEMFVKYNGILADMPVDTRIDGYAWAALTLVLLLWTPAFFRQFGFLSLIILALDIALPLITLVDLKILPENLSSTFSSIAAYALLAAALVAIYYSAALIVNAAYNKTVYPVFGNKKK